MVAIARILIVGCGSIGERHLRVFQKISGLKFVLCDSNEKRLREVAERYNVKETYVDFKDINLKKIDAMVICTPPNTHIPISLEGAKVGTHLLIEKPLRTLRLYHTRDF